MSLILLRTTAAERREEAELRDLFCKEPSSAAGSGEAAEEEVEAAKEVERADEKDL
jgi:hypothetical protein